MVRRSRAEWSEMVAKFETSGESVAKFCARKGIRPRTFTWWRWRLGEERRDSRKRESIRLVAVDVAPPMLAPRPTGTPVRIALADLDVHVEVGTDVGYVGALVGVLRSRC